jgi:protein tyrosine/serine phosphatase
MKKLQALLSLVIVLAVISGIGILAGPSPVAATMNAPPTFDGLASVTFTTSDNVYHLSWPVAIDDRTPQSEITYSIFASTVSEVSKYDFSTPVASTVGATSIDIAGLDSLQRYFFIVRAVDEEGLSDGNIRQQATRSLYLENATNFRDLGGYTNEWGLRVNWGGIYRSNNVVTLTDADLDKVNSLGWQRIVDMRLDYDISRDGGMDRTYAGNETKYDMLPFNYGDSYLRSLVPPSIPAPVTWPLSWDLSQVDWDNWYINIMEQNREGIKETFDRFADPSQYPIVLHCTQGKDRAGVVSALFLSLLDVPKATIVQDYMLTHDYTLADINTKLGQIQSLMSANPSMFPPGVTLADWQKLVDCYQPAMENLLNYLDTQYGGVEGFLSQIGVDETEQLKIMALNLEYPTVTDVSPASGNQGQAMTGVTITGTDFTGATVVSFGASINTDSFTVDSSTQITANITIDGLAATGSRDVSVTIPGGTGTKTGGFTVTVPPAPTVTGVSPNSGNQGQTMDVTITGSKFDSDVYGTLARAHDVTTVSFGSGITTNSFTLNSSDQITANITISSSATPSARDVSVTTPGGTAIKTGGFTVGESKKGQPVWIWIAIGVGAVVVLSVSVLVARQAAQRRA